MRTESLTENFLPNPELEACRRTFVRLIDRIYGSGSGSGLMHATLRICHLMKLELEGIDGVLARATNKQVHADVASCKPDRIGHSAPSKKKLEALQVTLVEQRRAFRVARFNLDELRMREKDLHSSHESYPSAAERRECSVELKRLRAEVNKSNKELQRELSELYKKGAENWPEVLRSVQKVESKVNLDCYDDIEPLVGKGRNEVSVAKFEGKLVVLKAYDLLKAGGATRDKVMEEIGQLEQMRHPNIVEVQNWFEHRAQGEMKIYVQMPRYDQDLCDWMKAHEDFAMRDKKFQDERRTVLLGLLRAVGRVHEFQQTHNDIKPENVLVTTERGKIRSVLCDFELLTAAADKGSKSGFTTGVGGTEPYTAPERHGSATQPTPSSDMYSVGAVILLCFARDHMQDARMEQPPGWHSTKGPNQLKWQQHWVQILGEVQASMPREVCELVGELLDTHAPGRPTARVLFERDRDSYFNRADEGYPVYWKHVCDDQVLRDLHEVEDETLGRIREALHPQMPDELGKGRDAGQTWVNMGLKDPGDRSIHVAKAWRVQNRGQWDRYKAAVGTMATSISCGPPLENTACNREKIMQTPGWPDNEMGCSQGGAALEHAGKRGFHPDGEDSVRQDVNEAFLLHGLPNNVLALVVANGFNPNYAGSNAGSLFGDGCYFAQDIEKVDQYINEAEPCYDGSNSLHRTLYPGGAADHPGNVCYALICRVAMGYSIRTRSRFYNAKTRQYQKQCPAIDKGASLKTECTARAMNARGEWKKHTFSDPLGFVFEAETTRELVTVPASAEGPGPRATDINYHSLVVETGGQVMRHREFVTFHREYVYPDFVVAYQRTTRAGQLPGGIEPEPEPE